MAEILQNHSVTRQFFPPKGNTAVALTLLLGIVSIFLVFRSVLGTTASPGGPIFSLLVLILLCLIVSQLIKSIVYLVQKFLHLDVRFPPVIGMLIIGVVLRNVPYNFGQFQRPECYVTINNTAVHIYSSNNILTDNSNLATLNNLTANSVDNTSNSSNIRTDNSTLKTFNNLTANSNAMPVPTTTALPSTLDEKCMPRYIGRDLNPQISGICRAVCLTVILLMAGLELDPVALQHLAGLLVAGTLIPCIVELCAAMVLAHFILGFDWLVAAILGVMLTGISAAVVIPAVLQLTHRNYGVAKGIPTLAIACCASSDAFAIAGMGILTGIYFNHSNSPLARLILQGPIEIIVGFLFAFLWGGLVKYLPNKDHQNLKFFRWLLLLCGGLISIFGSKVIGYEGAGGVSAVVGAFIANKKWRELGWEEENNTEKNLKKMWIILSPVIFGLVGTEVQLNKLDGQTVGLGLAVLFGTVAIRSLAAFLAMWNREFNWREMLFLAIAWIPKATVQAALGEPVFLLINFVGFPIGSKLYEDYVLFFRYCTNDLCRLPLGI